MIFQKIDGALRSKSKALGAAGSADVWRFYQGDTQAAHLPEYDDSHWPQVHMPHTWSGAAGDSWLRREFRFPELVAGIPTAGSRVELPLMLPIHATLYVDGVERLAEPSWLDTRA